MTNPMSPSFGAHLKDANLTQTDARFGDVPMMQANTLELPALDAEVLMNLERLQGVYHSSFVPEIIKLFLQEAPLHIAALRTALVQSDVHSAGRAAHALKGGSYQLGALPLALCCEALEQSAEQDKGKQCEEMFAKLEFEFDRTRQALHVRLKASTL